MIVAKTLEIDLSYRQDLPPEEVAAILNTSVAAVYTQKSRILDKLRAALIKTGRYFKRGA